MDTDFWIKKWESNQIGFHKEEANPALLSHFERLELKAGERIFLPLCGKTRDIAWLLSQGMQVVGIELSEMAVSQLFAELGVEPTIEDKGDLKRYSAENVVVFVGDIFKLSAQELGPVDAIYDRAAMVALPENMRLAYTKHLKVLTDNAKLLLLCFVYDQSKMEGPPFSIDKNEVKKHYGDSYTLNHLAETEVSGGFKAVSAREWVWLLN